jgi:arabinofuranosyltransferase
MHERIRTRTFGAADWLIVAGGLLLALVYGLWVTRDNSVPYEDAAMLLRYAQHLADGHGLLWNIGGDPVDGATDFLYTLVLGGVSALGLSVEHATRGLDYLAQFVTIAAVYTGIRRVWRGPRWMGAVSVAYLATGPAVGYIAAYFGTPFFAMFAALSWYAASLVLVDGATTRRSLAFALLALAMALTRPDGVVLAGAMVAGVVLADAVRYERGLAGAIRSNAPLIGWTAAVFVVLGGAYFAWHWSHYGHPMPNPFYVKGGDSGFVPSTEEALKLAGPFLLLLLVAFRSRSRAWIAVAALVPIGVFVLVWGVISQDTNYNGRFQYAIVPIVLMTWPAAAEGAWSEWVAPRVRRAPLVLVAGAAAVLVALAVAAQHRAWAPEALKSDGRVDVARALSRFDGRDHVIATTEAGLLPFYSNWQAVDTWGLNDEEIAHRGTVTARYLDTKRPAVIMFHAFFSPLSRPNSERGPGTKLHDWNSMVQTLKYYAEKRHYVLAAAFAPDSSQAHYYYVRRDLPDRDAIVAAIRARPYRWLGTGEPARNLARRMLQPAGGSG